MGGASGQGGPRTSWADGVHEPGHLHVPVLDVRARLPQLPLGRLCVGRGRGWGETNEVSLTLSQRPRFFPSLSYTWKAAAATKTVNSRSANHKL